MKGAGGNQIIKCIIYSLSKNKAVDKLDRIVEYKKNNGVEVLKYRKTKGGRNSAWFSDGEEWITVPIRLEGDNPRGYRWRKAWVDKMIPKQAIDMYIAPYGELYKWENYKMF